MKNQNNQLVINEKVTKSSLLDFVKASQEKITKLNKNLGDRVDYAVKMATKDLKKVTKEDLKELAQEIVDTFSATVTPEPVPMENSPKPTLKTKDKSKNKDKAKKEEKAEPENKQADKNKGKDSKKEVKVEADKALSSKSYALAKMFPAEIEHKELGKLVAKHEMTFAEFKKAIDDGETLYIATYWTKRHLKQFDYALTHQVTVPNAGFPIDLDILVAIIACDKVDRVWAMSSYTEAMFRFEGADFELVEDKDNNNNTYTIRVSNGMEFEIYAPAK